MYSPSLKIQHASLCIQVFILHCPSPCPAYCRSLEKSQSNEHILNVRHFSLRHLGISSVAGHWIECVCTYKQMPYCVRKGILTKICILCGVF